MIAPISMVVAPTATPPAAKVQSMAAAVVEADAPALMQPLPVAVEERSAEGFLAVLAAILSAPAPVPSPATGGNLSSEGMIKSTEADEAATPPAASDLPQALASTPAAATILDVTFTAHLTLRPTASPKQGQKHVPPRGPGATLSSHFPSRLRVPTPAAALGANASRVIGFIPPPVAAPATAATTLAEQVSGAVTPVAPLTEDGIDEAVATALGENSVPTSAERSTAQPVAVGRLIATLNAMSAMATTGPSLDARGVALVAESVEPEVPNALSSAAAGDASSAATLAGVEAAVAKAVPAPGRLEQQHSSAERQRLPEPSIDLPIIAEEDAPVTEPASDPAASPTPVARAQIPDAPTPPLATLGVAQHAPFVTKPSPSAVPTGRGEPLREPPMPPTSADHATVLLEGSGGADRIRVMVRGSTVHATILTEPTHHDALASRVDELRRALGEQGFTDARVAVRVASAGGEFTPVAIVPGETRTERALNSLRGGAGSQDSTDARQRSEHDEAPAERRRRTPEEEIE